MKPHAALKRKAPGTGHQNWRSELYALKGVAVQSKYAHFMHSIASGLVAAAVKIKPTFCASFASGVCMGCCSNSTRSETSSQGHSRKWLRASYAALLSLPLLLPLRIWSAILIPPGRRWTTCKTLRMRKQSKVMEYWKCRDFCKCQSLSQIRVMQD